jgi:hypothetical protein
MPILKRNLTRMGAAAALTALLTSCGKDAQLIPDALLVPPERPVAPAPGASDKAVARYILQMEEWSEAVIRQFQDIATVIKET